MKIVVLKFGGTSVGSIKRIKNITKIIISYLKKDIKSLLYLPQLAAKRIS